MQPSALGLRYCRRRNCLGRSSGKGWNHDAHTRFTGFARETAEELAREDGVSLDIWVTSALAQKIGAVETAAAFFRRRAAGAGQGLSSYLDLIPDNPPMPGDELPMA